MSLAQSQTGFLPMRDESDEQETQATPEVAPKPVDDDSLVLKIKTIRKRRQVEIEDENGVVQTMTLVEMTGIEKGKYLNSMGTRTKYDQNGKPVGVRDFTGLEASLISKCLYSEDGKSVPEEKINRWPVSAQDALMKACLKMNAMDEASREKEKNS